MVESPRGRVMSMSCSTGLPASSPIVGAVLSDAVRGVWIYRINDRVPIPADPDSRAAGGEAAIRSQVRRPLLCPYRVRERGHVHLETDLQGRAAIRWSQFPGGSCDLSLRAPRPSRVASRPSRETTSRRSSIGTGPSSLERDLPADPSAGAQPAGDVDVRGGRDASVRPGRRPSLRWTSGDQGPLRQHHAQWVRGPFRGPDPLERRGAPGARP